MKKGFILVFTFLCFGVSGLKAELADTTQESDLRLFSPQMREGKLIEIFRNNREKSDDVIKTILRKNGLTNQYYSQGVLEEIWRRYTRNHERCTLEDFCKRFRLKPREITLHRAELEESQEVDDADSMTRVSAQSSESLQQGDSSRKLIQIFQLCGKCTDQQILNKIQHFGLDQHAYSELTLRFAVDMYLRTRDPKISPAKFFPKFLKRFHLKQQ